MAPDSAALVLDVEAGPVVAGIGSALAMFQTFGSKITGAIGLVGSGIKATFSGAFSVISNFAKKVGETLATVFSVFMDQIPLFMADFRTGFSAGVTGARELESALFKANAQVKMTGQFSGRSVEDMLDLAGSIRDVSTFSRAAIVDAQGLMTQFLNVRGDMFDAAAMGAADLASALGTDLGQATQTLGAALNDPIQGLDALTQAGVRFTTQEQQFIKSLAASGRILEAQNAIMSRLNETVGGAALARSKTFTGQIDRLNNILQDTWTTIAQALVPAFEAILPYIESSTRATARAAEGFGEWVVEIVDWAKQSLPIIESWYNSFMEGATVVGKWIIDKLTYAFTFVQTAVQDLPSFWEAAVSKMKYWWEELSVGVETAWEKVTVKIENLWSDMIGRVKDSWSDLTDWTAQIVARIPGVAKSLGVSQEDLIKSLSDTQDLIKNQKVESRRATAKGPSQEDLDRIEALRVASEKASAVFGDSFAKNLEKNKGTVGDVMSEVAQNLGFDIDFEIAQTQKKAKDRSDRGKAAAGNPYALAAASAGAGSGGGFEDLMSLQKRIQSAAFKNPAVTAIDRQTAVINANHRQQMASLQAAQRAAAEQATASRDTANAVRETRTPGSVD